jgi:hypothetical protein
MAANEKLESTKSTNGGTTPPLTDLENTSRNASEEGLHNNKEPDDQDPPRTIHGARVSLVA